MEVLEIARPVSKPAKSVTYGNSRVVTHCAVLNSEVPAGVVLDTKKAGIGEDVPGYWLKYG